mmetsp:Transcript_137916/g.384609  ORF Transcript_137916/g.384609 Transcript_137916/m.384609 type:complete len:299 (-) Transcript_137916:50-946(-)
MGAGLSAKQYLWQPSQQLRLPAEWEGQLLEWLPEAIERLFGPLTFKTSSWEHLASIVDRDTESYATELGAILDPDSSLDLEVSGVRLSVLRGRFNAQEVAPAGLLDHWLPSLEPRITLHIDHNRRVISSTRVFVGDEVEFAVPALPSMREFGLEAKLQAERERCEAQGGDEYAIRLAHTYTVTKHRPPHGGVSWLSELVLLSIRMSVKCFVVVQVTATAPDAEGFVEVALTRLSGEPLGGSLRLRPEKASVGDLLAGLERRGRDGAASVGCGKLRLVFPGGAVLEGRGAASTQLSEVL